MTKKKYHNSASALPCNALHCMNSAFCVDIGINGSNTEINDHIPNIFRSNEFNMCISMWNTHSMEMEMVANRFPSKLLQSFVGLHFVFAWVLDTSNVGGLVHVLFSVVQGIQHTLACAFSPAVKLFFGSVLPLGLHYFFSIENPFRWHSIAQCIWICIILIFSIQCSKERINC